MITSALGPGVASNCAIDEMEPDALVSLILSADLPLLNDEVTERLTFYDRATLQRLAWQAVRCTQNRQGVTQVCSNH